MKKVRTVFGGLVEVTDSQARRVTALRRKYGAELSVKYDGRVMVYGRELMVVGRKGRVMP